MNWKKRRKEIRRAIKYPVLVFFIRLFILVFRFVPRKILLSLSAALGSLAFRLVGKERQKTIDNLTKIYGKEKSPEQIKEMARMVFVNQALNFADYVHTLHYTTRKQFSGLIDVVGEEHLKEAYNKGNGVICLMSHVGSWEFSAILPPVLGYETTAISRAMPNERIEKLIVSYRQKRGMKNISRGNAYPALIDALNKGECLVIMIDQDTQTKGVFVDFFGIPAYTPVGAARLAIDSGAAVLPMYMKRKPNNRHQFTILPALELLQTGNLDSDLLENTRRYTERIEAIVKEVPEQWVWMHQRWKTTPQDVELYLKKRREQMR